MGVERGLQIPPNVLADQKAQELLRVWRMGDGNEVFALRPDVWADPGAWGLLLADLARHAARACAENGGLNFSESYARVLAGLNAELSLPTDKTRV